MRAEIDRLTDSKSKVLAIMQRHLRLLWSNLEPSNPEATRDALLETLPVLVNKYGDMASVVALEWYQGVRAQIAGLPAYVPLKADPIPVEAIRDTTRWAVGGLWQDDADTVLSLLESSADRWVRNQGRATIMKALKNDPAKPKYARVPRGVKTCAYCTMLAARGWSYKSEKSASKSHPGCDCEIVPSFSKDVKSAVISGYDPEAYQKLYELGRANAVEPGDKNSVLEAMRRLAPDSFSDGVYPDAIRGKRSDGTLREETYSAFRRMVVQRLPATAPFRFKLPPRSVPRVPKDWPEDYPNLSDKVWSHILYGECKKGKFSGGHLSGHGWVTGGSEFPRDWESKDVFSALKAGLNGWERNEFTLGVNKIFIDIEGRRYVIVVSKKKSGDLNISTFYPV